MKLEFAIQTLFEGLKTEYKSNEGATWHKSIIDLRPCITELKPKPQESFFGLRLVEGGIMAYACYFNPCDRGDEFIAAYLYVPSCLVFSLPDDIIYTNLYTLLGIIKNAPNEDAYSLLKNSYFNQDHEEGSGFTMGMSAKAEDGKAGYVVRYYRTKQELKEILNPRCLY